MILDLEKIEPQPDFNLALGVPLFQTVDMKVKDLALIDCIVDVNQTIRDLTKQFEMNPDWPGVILVSANRFYGMITRHHCYEVLGKPFGIEVFSRKTVREFCDTFSNCCLVIDAETTIQEAVKKALARERAYIFEPIIIYHHTLGYRMLNMHILLLAQCDILENLYDEFHQLSTIDPLTQVYNRRGFFETAQSEINQTQIHQHDLSALMIDIDHFKKINDQYGHFVGDQVLRSMAEVIKQTLRQSDLLARYGGEEFFAMLPGTSTSTACTIAERLRESVEKMTVSTTDGVVSVTVSIGVCHISDANNSLDALLSKADEAMYWAKSTGRNQVVLWDENLAMKTTKHSMQHGIKITSVKKKKEKIIEPLSKVVDETIEGWSKAIEMRDKEMEGHARRVIDLTIELARCCGVAEQNMIDIRRGALLHDIGKIAIPDPILFKPGKLSEEEWIIMKKHPVYAYEFLSSISFLKKSLDIPYCHHEHWDGTGYPRGLKGNEIPLSARIFTIIDVWDALCTDRCYRPAWSEEEALTYIKEQSGKLFDPEIVDVFISLMVKKVTLIL